DSQLALSLFSLEDLPHELVLRLCAHVSDSEITPLALQSAQLSLRDQLGTTYQGEVVTACPTSAGVDLGVSFRPGLNPDATLLQLTLNVERTRLEHLVPLFAHVAGDAQRQAPLSAAAARVLEMAERTALLNGQVQGPEHLFQACTASLSTGATWPVLAALGIE